jgi:uncharacterized protein YbjT (DUF2867 family)
MTGKILVTGATGNTGAYLVETLVARGEKVKAASRLGKTVGGAEAVRFDLTDPSTYPAAFDGVDRTFLVIPAGYLNNVQFLDGFIRHAAERRVKVVFQTAFGVGNDPTSPYRKAELVLESSGTPFVILRPNWFSDNFNTFWLPGIRRGIIAVPAGDGKSSFIDTRDIGDSAVAALTSPAFDGKGFELTGPQALDYAEAAETISKIIGKPIRYEPLTSEAFVAMLTRTGMPEDYAAHLAELFTMVPKGWTAAVTDAVETLTGKPARSLAAYAAHNRAKFLD